MERLSEAKGEVRGKAGEHRANRKFSADVRDAIRQGRADDARALCAQQVRGAKPHAPQLPFSALKLCAFSSSVSLESMGAEKHGGVN